MIYNTHKHVNELASYNYDIANYEISINQPASGHRAILSSWWVCNGYEPANTDRINKTCHQFSINLPFCYL